jgi:hypothetical protein
MFYCGVGQVIVVSGKGAPGIVPQSITGWSAATGARVGADVPLPVWGRWFVMRLSADLLVTLHDVAFHFGDATLTNDRNALPVWTTPRLAVALGAGFATDLRLK